ncbi:hemolysin III family protein [Propioniciclava coleopterorum]|uniref:Hemolysin III family protein n=1 Tax=Propioniciclava coleopterorum TaxID=2714937 RepID=A0A6G7Y4K8_9ACTN|nr:hemolysin III family protein [Propioniciclava coleopterorum]QIK71561.1 hemolysin III family protein [Propioniciclava coleopterorum]
MDATTLKPRLRGWLHLGMTPLIQLAGVILLVATPSLQGRIGVAVYLAGATLLFGTSAIYHRGSWGPRAAAVLRRMDHANIFVFIAATYTPLALTLLDARDAATLLTLVWVIAAAGITVKVLWMSAPRWLYTAMYLAMGWVAVWWLPTFWSSGGPAIVSLIIAGGLVYSLGALVYARKRPDPSPTWFGFHEIFHACTIVAALCHFAAIALCVLR